MKQLMHKTSTMKLFFLPSILFVFTSLSSVAQVDRNTTKEDSIPFLGRWELVQESYEGQKLYDFSDKSKFISDSISSRKRKNGLVTSADSLEIIQQVDTLFESLKNNFLHFKVGGKVSAGVWINRAGGPISYEDDGIYDIDYGRVRVELRHEDQPIYLGGSFYWQMNGDLLFLHSTNHASGTYKVYRRAKE